MYVSVHICSLYIFLFFQQSFPVHAYRFISGALPIILLSPLQSRLTMTKAEYCWKPSEYSVEVLPGKILLSAGPASAVPVGDVELQGTPSTHTLQLRPICCHFLLQSSEMFPTSVPRPPQRIPGRYKKRGGTMVRKHQSVRGGPVRGPR